MLRTIHEKKLRSIVKELNMIIADIRKYIPEANVFLENGKSLTIHKQCVPCRESEIFNAGNINNCDAGGY